MDIIRICEKCRIRVAEKYPHHMFSQTKKNRAKYGKRIDHPANLMYLCSVCHFNKSLKKLREKEFLEVTK